MYIDTHAHYDDEKFSEDRDALLEQIHYESVDCIINPGCDYETSKFSLSLSRKYDFVYSAVGIHPENIPADCCIDELICDLEKLSEHPKCCAIGEIGLDYYWDTSQKELQKDVFKKQLSLALKKDLPVIVHDREAHGDCLDIVSEYEGLRGVFHCFSGSAEMAEILLKRGWYLGFDGPITYKNAKKALDVLDICPLDRILIETDSPYLPPVPLRGTRNHSGNLIHIAQKIAEIKNLPLEEIAGITSENARRLFSIV